MAETPEHSDYTSIQERIQPIFSLEEAVKNQTVQHDLFQFKAELKALLPFKQEGMDTSSDSTKPTIPFTFSAYLELVDWTGRAVLENKRGAIPLHLPPILRRLNIDKKRWLTSATQFEALHRQRFNHVKTPHLNNTA